MSVIRAERKGRFSWTNYLISRLSRLWVVLLPALVLTAAFDTLAIRDASASVTTAEAISHRTLPNFIGTVFFLQNILVAPFGSNGATWSLAFEFWYYILFPLLALAVLNSKRRWLHAGLFLLFSALCWGDVLALFPIWGAGVVVGIVAERWPIRSRGTCVALVMASLVVLVGVILATASHRLVAFAGDYALMAPSFTLMWALISLPPAKMGGYGKTSILFSEMSYTLYLTHQPLVVLLSVFWIGEDFWPADVSHLFLLLCGPIALAFVFAYLMYWLFESRTDEVRNWMKRRLTPAPAANH